MAVNRAGAPLAIQQKKKIKQTGLSDRAGSSSGFGALCRSCFFGNIESQLSEELSSHQHRL